MSTPGLSEKASLAQPADERAVPAHLRCNSCSKPVFNAFQTPHGCRICQSCVNTKLHPTEKRLCPGTTEACKDEDEEIHICQASCLPDIATRREISKLTVFCPNRDGGCREQMKLREVDTHLEKCEYEKVSCEQCRDSVLKKRLRSHLGNECRQRRVTCDLCQQPVVHSEMEKNHRNLDSAACCPKYTDYCPFCKDRARKLNRKDFVEHLKVCPDKPNECKYSHLGCERKARKSDLEKHYKEDIDYHLTLMDSKLRQVASTPSFAPPGALTAAPATVAVGASGEVDEVKRKVANIHDHFKKLQVNVANWAHTTLEFEQMADKFGGISQLRQFLKNLDDKIRQMDSSGGDSLRRPGANPDAVMVDSSSSLEQQKLNEIEFRLLNLESTNYDGFLVWKVSNLAKRRREAIYKRVVSIFSQPFFSRHFGFMFRVRLFLNGNESGEGSHLSLYLVLMQHEFDDIQEWPLKANVSFKMVNLRNRADDVVKTVRFDSGSQRPSSREDLSVCCGDAKFMRTNQFENSDWFVKNDSFYLEVEVNVVGKARRLPNPPINVSNCDGILKWTVSNFGQIRCEYCVFSRKFQCMHNDFCARFFPNGDYVVQGQYASVYLVLVKGEFDERLAWPFKATIELRLVNQKNRAKDVVHTVPFDTGERQPSSNVDWSHYCGVRKFVSTDDLLRDGEFVKNDKLSLIVKIRPCV